MPDTIRLFEVGPRDGLQNETRPVPIAKRIALIDQLSLAGFERIEVASFVSPKWVPQMAGAAEVLAGMTRAPGVSYAALTPNLHGLADAEAAHVDEVAVFVSASEGFSQANTNCSVAEGIARATAVADAATVAVRGYVSCIADCPFDGSTDPAQVRACVQALLAAGCYEVSLGDTLGHATPAQIQTVLSALQEVPKDRLAGHFHDTSGAALANIDVALTHGITVFDSSVGGLGGCPYAPGAAGNVATEAVLRHLEAQGYHTGLDAAAVAAAARYAKGLRGADV